MATSLTFDWKKWLRTAQASQFPIVLTSRHIYILPTRAGALFAAVLVAMLLGAINYSLSLAFGLTFLLASLGIIAMLHTWRNLAYLSMTACRAEPVFAGEDAEIIIEFLEDRQMARYAVAAQFQDRVATYVDIDAGGKAIVAMAHPTTRRGWMEPDRITFFTVFPLGLFYAWAYAKPHCNVLVYPRPALPGIAPPSTHDEGATGSLGQTPGHQDFAGLRNYQIGDSPKRIDWKASSREQGMFTKQFQGEAQSTVWLDWSHTPSGNPEQRISQLTRWVIDAHAERKTYGLRLPGLLLKPNNDEAHYRQCLQALAVLEPGQ